MIIVIRDQEKFLTGESSGSVRLSMPQIQNATFFHTGIRGSGAAIAESDKCNKIRCCWESCFLLKVKMFYLGSL